MFRHIMGLGYGISTSYFHFPTTAYAICAGYSIHKTMPLNFSSVEFLQKKGRTRNKFL